MRSPFRLVLPPIRALCALAAIAADVRACQCVGATLDLTQRPPVAVRAGAADDVIVSVAQPMGAAWTVHWDRYDAGTESVVPLSALELPPDSASIGTFHVAAAGALGAFVRVPATWTVPLRLVIVEHTNSGPTWTSTDLPGSGIYARGGLVDVEEDTVVVLTATSPTLPQAIHVFHRNALGDFERGPDVEGVTLRATWGFEGGHTIALDAGRLVYTGEVAGQVQAVAIVERDPFGVWREVAVHALPAAGELWGQRPIALCGDRFVTLETEYSGTRPSVVRVFARQSDATWSEVQRLDVATVGEGSVALHRDQLLVGGESGAVLYTVNAAGLFDRPTQVTGFGRPLGIGDTTIVGLDESRFVRCVAKPSAGASDLAVCQWMGEEYCGEVGAPRLRIHASQYAHEEYRLAAEVDSLAPGGWAVFFVSEFPQLPPVPVNGLCIEPLLIHTTRGPVRADANGRATTALPNDLRWSSTAVRYCQALTSSGDVRRWSTAIQY